MIPQIIHYCWFGRKPLPELALKCIASWKKFFPEYEIKEWNEDNFDVDQIPYTAQAYKCKKYAFVSDYARFKIMYEHGGIYFDTDVEVVKPMDKIIEKGPFFGIETARERLLCNPGLGFASPPELSICKEMIDAYNSMDFIHPNGQYNLKTVVRIISELLSEKGFHAALSPIKFNDIYFYPPEYFSPINYITKAKNITANTHTIHHYAASWVNEERKPSKIVKIWEKLHLPNTDIREKFSRLLKRNSCSHH